MSETTKMMTVDEWINKRCPIKYYMPPPQQNWWNVVWLGIILRDAAKHVSERDYPNLRSRMKWQFGVSNLIWDIADRVGRHWDNGMKMAKETPALLSEKGGPAVPSIDALEQEIKEYEETHA